MVRVLVEQDAIGILYVLSVMSVTVCTVCVCRGQGTGAEGARHSEVSTAGEAVAVLSRIEHFMLVSHLRVLQENRPTSLTNPIIPRRK